MCNFYVWGESVKYGKVERNICRVNYLLDFWKIVKCISFEYFNVDDLL